MTVNIHFGAVFVFLCGLFFLWFAVSAARSNAWAWFGCCIFLSILMFFWASHEADPETATKREAEDRQKAAQRLANETPHVVREADGCKVYAFLSGDRYHFFTRCPGERVVTDYSHEECTGSGKYRRCKDVTESIETVDGSAKKGGV